MPSPAAAKPAADLRSLSGIEVFRAGRHTDTRGVAHDFSDADVADLAARYDPALSEAPHVIGHPKTNAPAFGWVRGLQAVNGRLFVSESAQVMPEFADMLEAGRFKKKSLSLFPPDHPNNPTPGKWYPRHVGWLGAAPPAVKGLADFADDDGLVEFADWADELNASMWRRLRDWVIGQFGQETADKVLPSYDIEALQRDALRPVPTPSLTAFAEGELPMPQPNDQLAARAAELDQREAQLREREQALAATQSTAHQAGLAAFADSLIAEGRLLPAERDGVVAGLAAIPAELQVDFADSDGNTTQQSPLQLMQGFLKALPPRVDFSERAPAGGAVDGNTVDLSDSTSIQAAAVEFVDAEAKAGRHVSIDAAVQHVMDTHRNQ